MRRFATAVALVVLLSVGGLAGVASAHGSGDAATHERRPASVHRIVDLFLSLGIGLDVGTIGGNEWGGESGSWTLHYG